MGVNIVVWGIALSLHAVCHSFAGLFVVRFILGVCEGTMTSGMLLVTSMFYNRTEHGTRTAFWFLMNVRGKKKTSDSGPVADAKPQGTAQIVSGLLAYGVHHVNNSSIKQWQVFYVITGLITFVFGIAWMFLFPDNPHTAWWAPPFLPQIENIGLISTCRFFDENERHVAVERLRSNQSGIENKRWKKGQFAEALTDIKVWLFFFFSAIDNIPNALTVQVQQVYVELGFSTLTSTLLNIPSGCIEITTLLVRALQTCTQSSLTKPCRLVRPCSIVSQMPAAGSPWASSCRISSAPSSSSPCRGPTRSASSACAHTSPYLLTAV